MKRFFSPGALAWGTLVAALCAGLASLVALAGFGNAYYLSVLLPFAMFACLLVAWFAYLRSTGFARRGADGQAAGQAAEPRPAEPLVVADAVADAVADGAPGRPAAGSPGGHPAMDMLAPRDGSIVPRAAAPADASGRLPARFALLWAAIELGAASAVLYAFAGVGARFFL